MEGVLALLYLILGVLRSLFEGPSESIDRVETIITKGGDYIEGVSLEDVADLEDVELIESSRYGLMYADEYQPYNDLRLDRLLGLGGGVGRSLYV